ncbi:hypothetical protein SCG7086_BT_00060 [Chlamydiales bacterium SCGC AG-110-P3]|nr:hypothetical protein SCG7086_BT_00060 [Chlamydiales bacterium SCGC AG-110-P3]
MDIAAVQEQLQKKRIDGWLLFDFRRCNEPGLRILGVSSTTLLTRRLVYWVPVQGVPLKIVNRIEPHHLDHLPGETRNYSSWQEYHEAIREAVTGTKRVAMEYSPDNALPYISTVDAGTVDLVRGFGCEVVSSAALLQQFSGVWDFHKLETHRYAALVLQKTVEAAWELIGQTLAAEETIHEASVQRFILDRFAERGCVTDAGPICAVNAHSADPHYVPSEQTSSPIQPGDFVLIDLWCKQDVPSAAYADICRVAVAGGVATRKQKEVFNCVLAAQAASLSLIKQRFQAGERIEGWEADQAARDVIETAGYGEFFTHRTGHNIDESDHGDGTHLDNFETHDTRALIPRTCFSIEPGIYLPNHFGVRLETDVYLHESGKVEVTGGLQQELLLLC